MKRILLLLFLLSTTFGFTQVGVNTTNPDPSSMLDISATNKGVLVPRVSLPNVTTTMLDGTNTAATGLLIWNTNATTTGGNGVGFYFFNGALWIPLTQAIAGNTLDQSYDQGGAGVGKNINATDGSVRINGDDGFLVTGTFGTGNTIDTEITGAGTRMFFNPRKAAFRAGQADATEWNNSNIGNYSIALGRSNTALNDYDVAIGVGSTASGSYSTALGWANTASGAYSFSMGQNSTASGFQSTVLGLLSTATHDNAMVFGNNSVASGNSSFALGNFSIASGLNSIAFGNNLTSKSGYESVFGIYNTDYTPVSVGGFNTADRLFVIGNGTNATNLSNALTIYKDGRMNINDEYTLPTTDGTNGQVMQTNGAGVVTWANAATATDDQQIDVLSLTGDTLNISLQDDGVATQTVNLTSLKNTLDQSYDQGGAGVGRTITADAGAVTINGTDGLVTTGAFGSGVVAPSGAGTKMFFNPRRAAFRAGNINGTQWDDVNIGNYSMALGQNVIASGNGSVAFGGSNTASGLNSAAFGSVSSATSDAAFVGGLFNTASGLASTAFGYRSVASGGASTALGNDNYARSYGETVIGIGATDYTPLNSVSAHPSGATDRLFVVGNAIDSNLSFSIDPSERSNALVILKNGETGLGANPTTGNRLTVGGKTATTNFQMTSGAAASYILQSDATGNATWVNPSTINGSDHDIYEVGGTTAPNSITDNKYTEGSLTIGTNTAATGVLDIDNATKATSVDINNTFSTNPTGIDVNLTSNAAGKTGIKTQFNGTAATGTNSFIQNTDNIVGNTSRTAINNDFNGTSTSVSTNITGLKNDFKSTSNYYASLYGVNNLFANNTNAWTFGMSNSFSNGGNTGSYGVLNSFNGSSTGMARGLYNSSSNYNGMIAGVENNFSGSGNGAHYGMSNSLDGTGTGDKYGVFNYIANTAGGNHYGLYSNVLKPGSFAGYFLGNVSIGTTLTNNYILPPSRGTNGQIMQTDASGNVTWVTPASTTDHDWYEVGGTNPPNAITDAIYHNGDVAIGKNTADYALDISETDNAKVFGVSVIKSDNTNNQTATINLSKSTLGIGTSFGIKNSISTSNINNITIGMNNSFDTGVANLTNTAILNQFNVASQNQRGIFNQFSNTTNFQIGLDNSFGNVTSAMSSKGVNSFWPSANTVNADIFGVFNGIESNGNGERYGVYNFISGTGTGNRYGVYNSILSTAGGQHFGVYSNVLKSGSYAGYFLGNVSIGTSTANNYILPLSRGTNGQIMQTDAAGNVSWVNPPTDTDDQAIDVLSLTGNTLNLSLQNDGVATQTVDLSSLKDADWYEVGSTFSPDAITDNKFTLGDISIGKTTAANGKLDVDAALKNVTASFTNNNTTTGSKWGIQNNVTVDPTNTMSYGISNVISGNANFKYGILNSLAGTVTGSAIEYGLVNSHLSGGAVDSFGVFNAFNPSTLHSGFYYGMYNQVSVPTHTGGFIGVNNIASHTTNNVVYGISNSLSGSGSGGRIGVRNTLTGTSTNDVIGIDTEILASGTGDKYGERILISNISGGTHYGVYSEVSKANSYSGYFLGNVSIGTTTANNYILPPSRGTNGQIMQTDGSGNVSWANAPTSDADWYEVGGTATPNSITDNKYTQGSITIGTNTAATGVLDIDNSTKSTSIDVTNTYAASPTGINIDINSTSSNKVGVNVLHSGTTTGFGGVSSMLRTIDNSIGDFNRVGLYQAFAGESNNASIDYIGVRNAFAANNFVGDMIGAENSDFSTSNGNRYGTLNSFQGTGNGVNYGVYNYLSNTGTGVKYGVYNLIPSTAGGTHYGIYSNVIKAGSYAGYFLGNVSIGTIATNNYILPASRGTNGQIMQTDGSGNVSWVNPTTFTDTDDQQIDVLSLTGDTLNISLQDDAVATQTLNLGAIDNQGTDDFSLTGNTLNLSLQNDGVATQTVDLSTLANDWKITGNAGTASGTNFIGTTDAQDLSFRTNNITKLTLTQRGQLSITNTGGSVLLGSGAGDADDFTTNQNTFIGTVSGESTSSGNLNSALGFNSLNVNTLGLGNTAVGANALNVNVDGNNNTGLGRGANVSTTNLTNATAVGFNSTVNASNKIRLGNAAITVVEGQVAYTNPSDARFKFNVQENVPGLDFIKKLKPVTYNFDTKKFDEHLNKNRSKDEVTNEDFATSTAIIRTGFLAQDVEKICTDLGYNFDGLHIPDASNPTDNYGIAYSQFIMPIVKAVQEQQVIIETQKTELEQLKSELEKYKTLEERIKALEQK